ncbi:MAG: hypothetical protein JRN32_02620 [Nitrososphaerota archaeon]|jgi:hypothetical protein|nr:hypothetical protein [Nitrososphaerota archaeon]MDG7045694.1 hypothetical protein [Nitrososphaerota archaeon]
MIKTRTLLIIVLALMMTVMPVGANIAIAQSSNSYTPGALPVAATVSSTSSSTISDQTLPSQVASLADIALVNSSIIPDVSTAYVGSTTAPNIPLVSNFVTIPMPYLIPGFPAAPQVWDVLASNATFQTLYQAYGPSVLSETTGYSPGYSYYGWIMGSQWGLYYWYYVTYGNGTQRMVSFFDAYSNVNNGHLAGYVQNSSSGNNVPSVSPQNSQPTAINADHIDETVLAMNTGTAQPVHRH